MWFHVLLHGSQVKESKIFFNLDHFTDVMYNATLQTLAHI